MKLNDENSVLEGIDVSRYQGVIDWKRVSEYGITFAICKATEGETYRDLYFDRNIDEANRYGILVGAYHFFRGELNPISQADHFYSICRGKTFQLPPVLDFESRPECVEMACRFLGATEAYWGVQPLIYSYPAFIRSLKRDQWLEELAKFQLWIAHYNGNPGHPMATPPWQTWVIHQYSATGTIDGINGPVDRNVFLGGLPELQALGMPPMPEVPITEHIEGVVE